VSASVLLNGRFLAKPVTGVTRVGRELLAAITEELAARDEPHRLALAAPADAVFEPTSKARVAAAMPIVRGPASIPAEQMQFALRDRHATIVSFCNVTPLLARRAIVWIHDAHIFEAPDSYKTLYRLWHVGQLRGATLRRYRIVTVSDYSRRRLIDFGAPAARLSVIHNGGDHILRTAAEPEALPALGLHDAPFVLVMGSPAKHKNLPRTLAALTSRLDPKIKIAVVGLSQAGAAYADDGEPMPQDDRTIRLPRITDGVLRALYERAAVTIVPSVLEGFGLPAAEAMWSGGTLALANATALPEVGGQAALYFDPHDGDDIVRTVMAAMAPETAAKLRAAAVVQRERFQWRNSARALLSMLDEPTRA
jgi:hypothetical protein